MENKSIFTQKMLHLIRDMVLNMTV